MNHEIHEAHENGRRSGRHARPDSARRFYLAQRRGERGSSRRLRHRPRISLVSYSYRPLSTQRQSHRIALTTSLAIASASGGGTEFPICLYLSHLEPRSRKLRGKPCNAAASLTVILLIKGGTFTLLMSSPFAAFACKRFSQSGESGFLRSFTSIIGVLFPPIDAGSVWHGRDRSMGRPMPLKSIPA